MFAILGLVGWLADRSGTERARLEFQLLHAAEHSAIRLDAQINAARLLLAELAPHYGTAAAEGVHPGQTFEAEGLRVSVVEVAGSRSAADPTFGVASERDLSSAPVHTAWARSLLHKGERSKAPDLVKWEGEVLAVAAPIGQRGAPRSVLLGTIGDIVPHIEEIAVAESGIRHGRVAILRPDGSLLAGRRPLPAPSGMQMPVIAMPHPDSGVLRSDDHWIAYARSHLFDWVVALAIPAPASWLPPTTLVPISVAGGVLLLLAGGALMLGRLNLAGYQHKPSYLAPPDVLPTQAVSVLIDTEDTRSEILRDMGECFIALDEAGRIVEFNPRAADWAKQIDGDLQACLGRSFRDAVPRTRDSWFWAELDKVLETRNGAEFDLHSAVRPGVCLEFRLLPTESGCNIFFREVTKWRAAEHSAAAAQKMLQSTIDALRASIVILDRDGIIVRTNGAWRRLLEQTRPSFPKHAVGTRYVDVLAARRTNGAGTEPLAATLGAVLAGTRRDIRMDCEWRVTNGARLFQIRASRFDHGDGAQLIVVHEDVSEIQQAASALERVTESLLKSQEDERRRIARELHDSTAQHLVAAKITIDRIRLKSAQAGGNVASDVDEADGLLDRALSEIRNMSYLLHPPLLDQVGLPVALRSYASGFAKRSGVAIAIESPARARNLPKDVETALFRVLQEALANIHRHSGSKTARVQLRVGRARAVLQIEDDGKGIDALPNYSPADDLQKVGVGIPGMRARMRQLGGTLTVDSSANGTTIRAIVPILPTSRLQDRTLRVIEALSTDLRIDRTEHR